MTMNFPLIGELKLLEKLKTLARDVNFININSNNKEVHYHLHIPDSGRTNPEELNRVKEFLEMLPSSDNGYLMVTPEVEEKVLILDEYEKDGLDKDLINFVDKNLPKADANIWYASLVMKSKFEAGENIENIKQSIVVKHGDRGRNISNLCSANYLSSLIVPLFEHLVTESNELAQFKIIYEDIVMECPLAVFVSKSKTREKIKAEIIGKIQVVLKYGHAKVAVHGIGLDNVKTIQSLVSEIEQETNLVDNVDIDSHNSKGKLITATFNLK